MPALLPVRRSSALLVVLAAVCCAATLASCKDSGPEAPLELLFDGGSASAFEVIEVRVKDAKVPSDGATGTLGAMGVGAARLSDTSMSVPIPDVSAGQHELRLTVAGKVFAKTLTVTAAPTVTGGSAIVNQLTTEVTGRLDSIAASLANPASLPPGTNVAALQADLKGARDMADSANKYLSQMTSAQKDKVAAFLAANGVDLGSASARVADVSAFTQVERCKIATGATSLYTYEHCSQDLVPFLQSVRFDLAKYGIVGIVGAAAVAQGTRFTIVPPMDLTTRLILVGGGYALLSYVKPRIVAIGTHVWQRIITPQFDQIAAPLSITTADNVSASVVPATIKLGDAVPVTMTATYRSPTIGDVAATPGLGPVAAALNEIATLWNDNAPKIGITTAAPALPTTSPVSVVADVPPEFLQLGAMSLQNLTGTTSIVNGVLMLTLANEKQGADHPTSIEFKHVSTHTGTRSKTFNATVKPKKYAVAAVSLQVGSFEVYQGERITIVATLRDTANAIIASEPARTVDWTGNSTLATIHGNGAREISLEGKAAGTLQVTATCEGKTAQVNITVKPVVHLVATEAGQIVSTKQTLTVGTPKPYKIVKSDGTATTAIDYSKITLSGTGNTLGLVKVTTKSAGFDLVGQGTANASTTVDVVHNGLKIQTLTIDITIPDSTAIYKAEIPGTWSSDWYYVADDKFAQNDRVILYADGTGKRLSTTYADGRSVNHTGSWGTDPYYDVVWSVSYSAGRYHFSWADKRWNIGLGGPLTWPVTSVSSVVCCTNYYRTTTTKN